MRDLPLINQLLAYELETGIFTWRVSRGGWGAGRVAGRLNPDGYIRIGFNGKQIPAHIIAWAIAHGEWPSQKIDHINGVRSDNRISNLRLATQSQNVANSRIRSNNTSGYKGVSMVASGRWLATIKVHGKSRNLGTHDTPEAAHEAYMMAAQAAFGEFSRSA